MESIKAVMENKKKVIALLLLGFCLISVTALILSIYISHL